MNSLQKTPISETERDTAMNAGGLQTGAVATTSAKGEYSNMIPTPRTDSLRESYGAPRHAHQWGIADVDKACDAAEGIEIDLTTERQQREDFVADIARLFDARFTNLNDVAVFIGTLFGQREAAERACAEMRDRIRAISIDFVPYSQDQTGDALDEMRDALKELAESTTCGQDYVHRSEVEKARDALERDGCHGLDTPERVCFYEQDFYVLSNFSSFNVTVFGREFPTSEHAYHWKKFSETNTVTAMRVRVARSAHEAFKIAEKNRGERREDWDAVKVDIMREILRAKVAQHEYVRRKLLATGNRELVENSWRDDFWGWGRNKDGQNMLGKLWMEIRAELQPPPTPRTEGGEG